jgi:hypothetical protein
MAYDGVMLTDDELVEGFQSGTLSELPHASHVRLTLIYLSRYGLHEALPRLADGLLLFATLKGHPEKFHLSMTRAWLELIESARRTHPEAADAEALVAACPELLDKNALSHFYSAARLSSDDARAGWLAPDLVPIDFRELRSRARADRLSQA